MTRSVRTTFPSARSSAPNTNGRSRGSEAKPYPVPWSIAPQDAPKFEGSKIRHVSDLDEAEFARFAAKWPTGLELYEKVDGGVCMLAGVDSNGFWTSKKTGKKRRSSVEYDGQNEAVCRAVHVALAGSKIAFLPEGTFISADVLYGARPNTICYDGRNRIVAHGMYDESTGCSLKCGSNTFKLTEDWDLCFRRRLSVESVLTEGETDRQLIESTMIGIVKTIPSDYGADEIEGLVARDPETGDLVKLIDKSEFTAKNNLYWEYRQKLGKGTGTKGNWKKGVRAEFRESFAEHVLGTRSVLSPTFSKRGYQQHAVAESIDVETARSALHSALAEAWHDSRKLRQEMYLVEGSYPDDIRDRNVVAFKETFDWLNRGVHLIESISSGEQLVEMFLEGLNFDRNKTNDLMEFIAQTWSPVTKKLNSEDQGHFSNVYLLQDGKVLKVTNEESGTDSAFRLKGKNLPGIARVFDVGKMPDRFKEKNTKEQIYYVLLEHLEPLESNEQSQLTAAAVGVYLLFGTEKPPYGLVPWEEFKTYAFEQAAKHHKNKDAVAKWLFTLERNNIPEISETLAKNRVYGLYDFNGGNIMLRGDERVLVDFGSGKTSSIDHKAVGEAVRVTRALTGSSQWERAALLEAQDLLKKIGLTEEKGGRAASIGLTVGRFQPFHKDHARLIRKMAQRYDKVIIAVTGNKRSAENPFPFELRKELIDMSLPDVEPKLEIYKIDGGAFLPSILEHVADSGSKSYQPGDAVEVVVGEDRFEEFKRQIERAVDGAEVGVDMSAVRVIKAPDSRDGAVSGKQVRDLISSGDLDGVKKFLDPHCASDPAAFDEMIARLQAAVEENGNLKVESILVEFLTDIDDSKQSAIEKIGKLLEKRDGELRRRDIVLAGAKFLGAGRNGGAWRLADGRVFKATTDKKEAKSAIVVMRARRAIGAAELEHIYHVEDVFAIADIGTMVYGIVQEAGLEKPSAGERNQFDSTVEKLKNGHVDKKLVKKFGIDGMARELKELGLEGDLHGGNVLKRGDRYVLIDLGTAGDAPERVDEDLVIEDDDPGMTQTQTTAAGKPGLNLIGGTAGAQGIVDRNRVKLVELGIDVGAPLGNGQMGVAFDAGGGRVLKVTVDRTEAAACSTLIGKKLKHVNTVYEIFWFKKTNADAVKHALKVYGILGDKLEKLSPQEESDIDEIADNIGRDDMEKTFATQGWSALEAEWATKMNTVSKQRDSGSEWRTPKAAPGGLGRKATTTSVTTRWNEFRKILVKYQVPELIDELRGAGIQFADYKAANVMKRGSDYVVIDLSLSKTPGGNNLDKAKVVEGVPGDGLRGSGGSSAWSSGMMARIGVDDYEERDRALGWRGKQSKSSTAGQSESVKTTRTKRSARRRK